MRDARLGETGVVLLVSGMLALGAAIAACDEGPGGGCDDYSSCFYGPVTLDRETFEYVQILPASALAADDLEPAGTATAPGGERVTLARSANTAVPPAHLVSAAEDGWFVWRPVAIAVVLAKAGAGGELIAAEHVDWPDSCLGGALPDEVCAAVITPGYRIVVRYGDSAMSVFHTDLAGNFKTVSVSIN